MQLPDFGTTPPRSHEFLDRRDALQEIGFGAIGGCAKACIRLRAEKGIPFGEECGRECSSFRLAETMRFNQQPADSRMHREADQRPAQVGDVSLANGSQSLEQCKCLGQSNLSRSLEPGKVL